MTKRFSFGTVEGIDGAGKDYQLLQLISAIREENNGLFGTKYDHIIIGREPTKLTESGIRISEAIREGQVTAEFAANGYINDRKEHSRTYIEPNLNWAHFISSRYDISTLTYQMSQGMDLQNLYDRHGFENKECLIPDYTIIFDLPAEIAFKRIGGRNSAHECFEKLDFLKKARDAHLKVADFLTQKERNIIMVNANQTREEVTKEMLEKILANEVNHKFKN